MNYFECSGKLRQAGTEIVWLPKICTWFNDLLFLNTGTSEMLTGFRLQASTSKRTDTDSAQSCERSCHCSVIRGVVSPPLTPFLLSTRGFRHS